ncbi:MAG: hypothetical protein MN733_31870 [Nitrososphaera sp.]|nr:hypothetical protein [Nitrososphaera sp.]
MSETRKRLTEKERDFAMTVANRNYLHGRGYSHEISVVVNSLLTEIHILKIENAELRGGLEQAVKDRGSK